MSLNILNNKSNFYKKINIINKNLYNDKNIKCLFKEDILNEKKEEIINEEIIINKIKNNKYLMDIIND